MDMAKNIWVCCVGALALAVVYTESACPESCICSGTNVTCGNITAIPEGIPQNVTWLELNHLQTNLLPSVGFAKFSNLSRLEFVDSEIQNVDSLAFYGLKASNIMFKRCLIGSISSFVLSGLETVGDVVFYQTIISSIDSYAFSNISNIESIRFHFTVLNELRSYAVTEIERLGVLDFRNASITTWAEKAVYGVNQVDAVSFFNSLVETMHPEAIANIGELTQLIFTTSAVMEMKEYAISDIGQINNFQTYQAHFKVIRSNAISKNNQINQIALLFSSVDDIESFAFTHNGHINTFRMYEVTIKRLRSFAFNDSSIDDADLQSMRIGRLDCGTMEYVNDIVSRRFTFTPAEVTCDSNICWMFHPNRTRYLRTTFNTVKCSAPNPPIETGLGALLGISPANLPFNCSNYNFTAAFACSGSPRITGQVASLLAVVCVSLMSLTWLTIFRNFIV